MIAIYDARPAVLARNIALARQRRRGIINARRLVKT